MVRRPRRVTRTDTLLPYRTLFRSRLDTPTARTDKRRVDGSPTRGFKGNAERAPHRVREAAAAPATVSGEQRVTRPLFRARAGDGKATRSRDPRARRPAAGRRPFQPGVWQERGVSPATPRVQLGRSPEPLP